MDEWFLFQDRVDKVRPSFNFTLFLPSISHPSPPPLFLERRETMLLYLFAAKHREDTTGIYFTSPLANSAFEERDGQRDIDWDLPTCSVRENIQWREENSNEEFQIEILFGLRYPLKSSNIEHLSLRKYIIKGWFENFQEDIDWDLPTSNWGNIK